MNPELAAIAYLLAASLFIVGLKQLGSARTARRGNQLAAIGMLIAIVVTLADRDIVSYGVILAGLVVGGSIGAILARRIEMTSMPQLVAAFNGFGGGASALVAAAEFLKGVDLPLETDISISLSTAIGAVTLTGSFVAFGKLQGIIAGRPVTYPGQRVIDVAIAAGVVAAAIWTVVSGSSLAFWTLAATASILGIARTLPIGGADMPVVVAFLNSMSGIAASAAGFVIGSNALIISGALVGAAGLILTSTMSKGMNRSLANVLFSAFGAQAESQGVAGSTEDKPVRSVTVDDVAVTLAYADSVIVVPGYGLAVAQAQHAMRELADQLEARGVQVRYAIHPVAGRMPGHMNVLLAEADVPYEMLLDLDEINDDFDQTDVSLVVGANDVVNPTARDDSSSPIYGMPILNVDRARNAVVIKRSLSPGFAGIDNPLFYEDDTLMLFADAKSALEALSKAVRDA
ncbi:MAG TPA: NAD(P)(+) transhydrogenase (Re/Si-specific) subunit beta [Actinobacteria bacterium]|nr:NAD(P)(+) transhydrogenase (Re/Si-specific) subunit beta [Actinomycetota bacterium]